MALERFFRAVGVTPRVEGLRVLLIEDEVAAKSLDIPQLPVWDTHDQCDACSKKMEPWIVATALPGKPSPVFEEAPVVVDAWRCPSCASFRYPRAVEPDTISSFGKRGAELGRAGRFREAEWWLVRITWDWPTWPSGWIDLGQVLRGQLEAESDVLVRNRRIRRAEAAFDRARVLLQAVQDPAEAIRGLALTHLNLAELALLRRAYDVAGREAQSCVQLEGEVPEVVQTRAAEVVQTVTEERWIFEEAAHVIGPLMDLVDRPGAPIATPEVRKRAHEAVEELEAYHARHPHHWPSAFFHAMGLKALGYPDKALPVFRTANQAHPDRPEVIRELGKLLLEERLHDEALGLYRAATRRLPEIADLWANRAVTELLGGDLAEARACVAQSLRLDPSDKITLALDERLTEVDPNRLPQSLAELEGRH